MKDCSLYIHIPYCNGRCYYCDFHSGSLPVSENYIDALIHRTPKRVFKSVYVGGGTPSLLTPEQLERICKALSFDGEFTVEANPDSLTAEFLQTALRQGVNRLSLGIQSLNDVALSAIGRLHTAEKAVNAVKLATSLGMNNISIDLMVGIPHQQNNDIARFIETADELGVSHVSCYMLKLEPGTPLYSKSDSMPSTDDTALQFEFAIKVLAEHGFNRYEISNFAKDKRYSQHNMRYWDCLDYIGIGPSAHSCVDGKRFYYPSDTKQFIDGCEPIADGSCDAEDYIMLQTRLTNGLSLTKLYDRFGYTFSANQLKKIRFLEKKSLLRLGDKKLILTDRGLMLQNSILAEIL